VLMVASLVVTACAEVVITPETHGAVGDGKADDTEPVRRSVAACGAVAVRTPPQLCRVVFSKSYLSGPIVINSSRTTLEVKPGATLAMLERARYCKVSRCPGPGAFISTAPGPEGCRTVTPAGAPPGGYQVCLSDVTITGGGVISSSGNPWADWWLCARLELGCFRPGLVALSQIEGATINGSLTLRDSPNHNLRVEYNVHARISGLVISAPYSSPNTDGINVYGGFDALLEHCVIDNGDDCVSIVPAGEDIDGGNFCHVHPGDIRCSGGHAIVRNFTCNGGHGLSIGGVRHGTVSNVTFSGITATGGQAGSTQDEEAGGGCRIKSYPNSTGIVHAIRYEDMTFHDVYWPVQLLGRYCPFPCRTPDGNTTTRFANISFSRVRGSSSQRKLVAEFKCTALSPCQNITWRDVALTTKAGGVGELHCENVGSYAIDNASSPRSCSSSRLA